MKLGTKILLVFLAALSIGVALIYFGLIGVLDRVSTTLLYKQAETATLYLEHSVGEKVTGSAGLDLNEVALQFATLKHVADEARSFDVARILLVGADLKVIKSYPDGDQGSDRRSSPDIVRAFEDHKMSIGEETEEGTSTIDVVDYFTLGDGTPLVLEVQLDFADTEALLEDEYSSIETMAVAAGLAFLILVLGVLAAIIVRTAIRPVLRMTKAMEAVGNGDLTVKMPETTRDEFGTLAREFNRMVHAIKERMKLSQYVSQGTLDAVRTSVADARDLVPVRKTLVLFFSDLRGFTTYSESRDPAHVILILNKILSLQATIIRTHGGDLDKFVGDEVMAVFDDAASAAAAAWEIQTRMDEYTLDFENLRVGIGLHRGVVMQGNVGSEDVRSFTVIGDVVNTAARLQAQAPGGQIVVSQDLFEQLDQKVWQGQALGSLPLKGKSNELPCFTLTRSS